MHADVSLITYTDWGQNCGRYTVGNHVNALLSSIRTAEGGIVIHYTGGQADYTMEHEMLDASSVIDGGHGAAIGINWLPSVAHNYTLYPAFTAWKLGYEDSVHYNALNTYSGTMSGFPTFSHQAGTDYRVDRLSKIVNDVTTTNIYSDAEIITEKDGNGLDGVLVYRVGGGGKGLASYDGSVTSWGSAYAYTTGGIMTGDEAFYNNRGQQDFSIQFNMNASSSGVSTTNPMPFACQGGDSGSPLWIYNEATHAYEYVTALQSGGGLYSQSRGNVAYTQEVMTMYNVDAAFGTSDSVTIHASTTKGTAESDTLRSCEDDGKNISATKWYGTITAADGTTTKYVGVKQAVNEDGSTTLLNVWKNLSDKLDDAHWYAYGTEYFQASDLAWKDEEAGIYSNGAAANTTLTYADLFSCSNLIFSGTADKDLTVNVNEVVELGVGYVQFSLADDATKASFNLAGTGSLDSAGYVVDEGVSLHSTLTGDASYIREWRKGGKGDFYIEGTGDNKVLLSVGGGGTTYLNRTNGYAAYNVLASTGETIVITDINQIYRDMTLGNDGGTLDMNGLSMTWNNDVQATETAATEGFTIHALDECAVISNNKAGSTTTLTWTQTGDQTWLGSFKDSDEGGALQFIYNGGAGSTLTMHSIATNLTHQSSSGLTVQSGTLALGGTLTVHGKGSVVGNDNTRLVRSNDWHYADAATPVTVQNGGTFELQSHARLTGNVTVQDGGTFIMHEGVQSRYEYVEGGESLEDTDKYSAFFGLKGNVTMESGSAMKVQFTSGTTSDLAYADNITGEGSFTAELGLTGRLTLSGKNTVTGSKEIVSGGIVFKNEGALGSEEWKVDAQAYLVSDTFTGTCSSADILSHISTDSTGVLALNADRTEAVVQQGLYIGADAGTTVSYGSADEELEQNGTDAWLLGGGGGTLEVNFKLTGEGDLEIGNAYTTGVVKLTNASNDFTGDIHLNGAVTLGFVEGALGSATLNVGYGQSVLSLSNVNTMLTNHVAEGAEGVLALDDVTDGSDLNLSSHTSLALGASKEATLSGSVTLGSGADYNFSGMGLLHVQTALADGSAGATDMVVDGQGLTGGVIQLETAATLTGAVEVYGHKELTAGSITLNLATTGALDTASGVTVKQGGSVSVAADTTQTFKTLTIAGGAVTGNGKIIISGDATVSGGLNTASVESQGAMSLSGTNTYGLLTVSSGTLTVGNDNALSGDGYTVLGDGATLNLNGHKDAGFVGIDSNATATVSGGTLTGSFEVATSGTASVSGLTLTNTTINETGGTIELAGQLTLYNNTANTTQTIGGTISGGKTGATGTIYSANTTNNAGVEINAVNVEGGSMALTQVSWNTNWTIHSLEGSGTLKWAPNTTHWYSSALVLDGENSFSGTIEVKSEYAHSDRVYQKFLELANDKSAQNATVYADGKANAVMAVALNTDRASMKGIAGNAYSLIYAGSAVNDATSTTPTSTREAELVLTGMTVNTFAGTVSGADKIDLTMEGTGEQVFSGSVAVRKVSAESGKLTVSGSSFTYSDLSISGGATFSRGSSDTALTVAAGNTLSVVSGTAGSAASLTGGLTLSGGTMVFDGTLLDSLQSAGTYALSVSGTVTAESASSIGFTSTCSLVQGKTYYLASGDWTSATTTLTLDSSLPAYLKGTLAGTAEGLTLSTTQADNAFIWAGKQESNTWTEEQFGTQASVPESDSVVAFTDTAESKDVQVTATTTVGSLVFDHTGTYNVTTDEGVTLTAAGLEHNSSGTTTLSSGVVLTGDVSLKAGELVLQSMSTLGSNSITAQAGATLGLDIGTNSAESLSATGLGTLHLLSGRYKTSGAAPAEHVIVDNGGQLYMYEGTATHDVTIAGSGWAYTDDGGAAGALRVEGGASISGDVTLADDASVMVMSNYTGTLSGAVNTAGHTLTKNGSGTLVLSGSLAQSGAMVINAGTVRLTPSATTVGLGTVTVNEGATLYVWNQVLDASNTDLILNKGTLHSQDQYGLTGPTFKSLTVNDNSTISSTWEGMLSFGSLTGSGDISVNTSSGVFALNVGELSGYSGTLNESGRSDGQLYIGTADISGTVVSGLKTYLRDGFVKSGSGTLQLNKENTGIGTTTVSEGKLLLNGNTTLVSLAGGNDGTLEVGSGVTLTINGDSALSGLNISNAGTMVNNGTLTGTASLSSLDGFAHENDACVDYLGNSGADGFISMAKYRIFSGTGSTSGLTIDGMTYVSDGLYGKSIEKTATSSYYLNSADKTLNVTDYLTAAGTQASATNGIVINNTGATLTASANTTLNAAVTSAQAYTVQVDNGATLSYQTAGSGAITKTGEGTLALANGSVISGSASISAGTVTLADGAAVTVASGASLSLNEAGQSTSSVLLQGGTLNYLATGTAYTVANKLSATAASVLSLGDGVTFAESNITSGASNIKLTGSGRYELSTYASTPSLAAGWTGTVVVPVSAETNVGFNLNKYGTNVSTVELHGLSGWANLWNGNTDTYTTNIRFVDTTEGRAALDIKYISDNRSVTFNGALSGTGTFALTAVNNTNQTYTFNGDVSAWTGSFAMSSTASATLKFAQNATEINAALKKTATTGTLTVNAAATADQSFKGDLSIDALTMTGAAVALAGTNTISGAVTGSSATGNLNIAGATTIGGALNMGSNTVSVGAGASLTVDGAVTVGSVIENSGTLVLNGSSLTLSGTAAGSYSEGENGFIKAQVVRNSDSGAVTAADLSSLTIGSTIYTGAKLLADGTARTTTYYLNSGSLTYGDAGNAMQTAGTVALNGGSLVMGSKLSETTTGLSLMQDGEVTLNEGVVLAASQVTTGSNTLTLEGSGSYALTSATKVLSSQVQLGESWTGAVRLSGAFSSGTALTDADLTALTRNGSSVELCGVSGLFAQSATITSDLVLTDSGDTKAYSMNDGWNNDVHTFAGKLTGKGTFARTSGTGTTQNIVFSGDVSGWTGAFTNASDSKITNVTFSGSAATVNAAITNSSGTLNVIAAADAAQTFTKAITANTFTMKGAGVSLQGDTTLGSLDGSAASGNLTFAAGTHTISGDLNMGSNTFSVSSGATVGVTGAVTIGSSIVNAGNLTLSGTLALSGSVGALEGTSFSDTASGSTTNGYSSHLNVIRNNGGTVSLSATQITVGSTAYTLNKDTDGSYYISTGDYHINEGTVTLGGTNNANAAGTTSIIVKEKATLGIDSTDTSKDIALFGGTIAATNSSDVTLSGAISTGEGQTGTLTKSGSGILKLTGAAAGSDLRITQGTVQFGTSQDTTTAFGFRNVEVDASASGSNSTFYVQHSSTGFSGDTNLTLKNGGKLFSWDQNASNNVAFNKLTVEGGASIGFQWNGGFSFTEMTGGTAGDELSSNQLTITQVKNEDYKIAITTLKDFNGSINANFKTSASRTSAFTIAEASQAAGYTAEITGNQALSGLSAKTGEGTLRIASGGSMTTAAADNLTVSGGTLDVRGTWTVANGASVTVSDSGKITRGGFTIGANGENNATLTSGADSTNVAALGSDTTVSQATVTYSGSEAASISAECTDSLLVNASTAGLTDEGATAAWKGVDADHGDITFLNKETGISVTDLTVAVGKTVGVYTDSTGATESNLVISGGSLTTGAGAQINANLSISGTKVSVADGGLKMGSTLTLNSGNTLDNASAILSSVNSSGSYTLFTGVDGVSFGGDAVTSDAVTVAANSVFSNISEGYSITYSGGTDGTVYLTPEPATATLSLLALAGLAARRRRK